MAIITSGTSIVVNGSPIQLRGINIYATELTQWGPQAVLDTFPGITLCRINVFDLTTYTPAALAPFVSVLTGAGCVVEIEDHNYPTCLTGSALATAASWYAACATAFLNNPLVIFGTQNEPDNSSGYGAIDTEISTIVNAIRATGNQTLVLMCPYGGYSTNGLTASVYQALGNVAWDLHFYAWVSNYTTSLSANVAGLNNEVAGAQGFVSKPVVIGEYGIAAGNGTDTGGTEVVQAVQASGLSSAAWAWISGGTNALLLNDTGGNPANGLTSFGSTTASFIKGAQQITSSPTPPPPPPSGNAVFCWPGKGSFADANGVVYSITAAGDFMVGAVDEPDGHGTCAAAYYNGTVYAQDGTSFDWYTWNGSTFNPAPSPPPIPPLSVPSLPPVVADVEVAVWDQLSATNTLTIPVTIT